MSPTQTETKPTQRLENLTTKPVVKQFITDNFVHINHLMDEAPNDRVAFERLADAITIQKQAWDKYLSLPGQ